LIEQINQDVAQARDVLAAGSYA
jgi:hypothetical protein